MADVKLNWYGDQIQRRITSEMEDRLDRAAQYWSGFAGSKLRGKLNRRPHTTPSKPGDDYPATATGQLAVQVGSSGWERLGRLARAVGTNLKHGKWLQIKTGKGRRPWMSTANRETTPRIKRILGKPM